MYMLYKQVSAGLSEQTQQILPLQGTTTALTKAKQLQQRCTRVQKGRTHVNRKVKSGLISFMKYRPQNRLKQLFACASI